MRIYKSLNLLKKTTFLGRIQMILYFYMHNWQFIKSLLVFLFPFVLTFVSLKKVEVTCLTGLCSP